ncbi:phosphoenolpyruvate--protein phosphotransferase [Reinekea sp. G2M2-21]|uniref:phosphoenolpyruvate--protein phosphotransferase n=1 Tax=Reinekea sp. G2M2-21 TaxID=2788942 RepID=UPI0018ABF951|nr:phosphoenolpyruvate--protein phosphotransferase [Reinekea sp. G2M2-21]
MLSPLLLAKKILLDAGQMTDQRALVALIVERIRSALNVDVCSLYLVDANQELVLSATQGLAESAVGNIRMKLGEGLVGTIAKRQHLLNLPFAEQHPNFRYFEESGEERYQGFLGVPMIHHGDVLGVLVVQVKETRRFDEEEEAFLITMGAHLVASQAINLKKTANEALSADQTRRLTGIAGSPGATIAKAWVVRDEIRLEDIAERDGSGLEFEQQRIAEAFENAVQSLDSDDSTHGNTETLSALIDVYKLLLNSPELHQAITEHLAQNVSASTALKRAMQTQIAVFDAMEDPYLKARADDLRVLGVRVYRELQNLEPEVIETDEPIILIGENITVEHFTRIDSRLIAGIVSNQGSKLSHTSVLANALGIPAVVGLAESNLRSLHGLELILDGHRGQVISNPPDTVRAEYQRLINQNKARQADLAHLKLLPAESTDGERVRLYSNTGLLADISPGLERGSEGIGLYRSEIPFMVHNTFPTEEEQVRIYRGVLEAYAPKPVVMRTLDIGGDKALPYFPIKEENPFLGWRGIRFTLDYRNIQLDQIRAMLLANVGNDNLQIMVPMLSHEDELERVHALIDEAVRQLKEEGNPVHKPPVGIMAEVPAVIWMLPRLRDMIDFVSIGSNDLTQYLLAVDRNNPRVAHLYSHFHPAVLCAIRDIVRECRRLNLTVSVCGEMASDPKAVLLLLGMGVRTLSMSAFKLPVIKWLVRRISMQECRAILDTTLELGKESEVQAFLSEKLKDAGYENKFE